MSRPTLETLEARNVPAVSINLIGTSLNLSGVGNSPHSVLVRQGADGGTEVLADGVLQSFQGLTRVNYQGANQVDTFVNRTTLPGSIDLGQGDNVVNTIAPGSQVAAGDGDNVLQATGGNSTITAGNGDNNVYGGPGDTIVVGNGANIVYDILPGNQTVIVGGGDKVSYLFVGPQTTLVGAQSQDKVARFFAPGRTIGAGTLVLDGRTLYYAASNAGDTYVASPFNSVQFQVTTITNGVLSQQFFNYADVDLIANFGGAGADTLINNTAIPDVQYGAGGQNLLLGGFGSLNLLKAGGAAGSSVAIGRSPVYNDLTGSSVSGTTTVLVSAPGSRVIFRTNSVLDVLAGQDVQTLILSLYVDQQRR